MFAFVHNCLYYSNNEIFTEQCITFIQLFLITIMLIFLPDSKSPYPSRRDLWCVCNVDRYLLVNAKQKYR